MFFSAVVNIPIPAANVTVGALAGNNKLGEVEEAAYDWASENFQTNPVR